jgi:hypothetical protein
MVDLEPAFAGSAAGVKGLLKEAVSFLERLVKQDEKSVSATSGI